MVTQAASVFSFSRASSHVAPPAVIGLILALASFLVSAWNIGQLVWFRKRIPPTGAANLLTRWFQVSSILDLLTTIWFMSVFVPEVSNLPAVYSPTVAWRRHLCTFLGVYIEFLLTASLNWYLILSLITFALAKGVPSRIIRMRARAAHLYVWTISTISALLLLAMGEYGQSEAYGLARDSTECWLKPVEQGLLFLFFFYLPLFLCMVAGIIVLIYILVKALTSTGLPIPSSPFMPFVLLYWLVWLLPFSTRCWLFVAALNPSLPPVPDALNWVQTLLIVSHGIVMGLVWRFGAAGRQVIATFHDPARIQQRDLPLLQESSHAQSAAFFNSLYSRSDAMPGQENYSLDAKLSTLARIEASAKFSFSLDSETEFDALQEAPGHFGNGMSPPRHFGNVFTPVLAGTGKAQDTDDDDGEDRRVRVGTYHSPAIPFSSSLPSGEEHIQPHVLVAPPPDEHVLHNDTRHVILENNFSDYVERADPHYSTSDRANTEVSHNDGGPETDPLKEQRYGVSAASWAPPAAELLGEEEEEDYW